MPTVSELNARLWTAIKSDMTMMIGLDGVEGAHPRPMTAQVRDDDDREPGKDGRIYFFTSRESELVEQLGGPSKAIATFASKGHKIFATMHGQLAIETDQRVIDALWNPFVAAWFEEGKDDPKLRLLRFDAGEAEIWLDDSSFFAGIKMLLGIDPKVDYRDKVAKVEFP